MKRKFLETIKKGLGKAYIELSTAENREEYKDTLLYACFHDCSYEYLVEGSKGDYLFALINLLEDKEYFKQEVIKYLNNALPEISLFAQLIDILEAFYFDGDKQVKTFFAEYYDIFITKGRWTKNKKLCYEYLCIKMYRIYGLKKTLKILDDIERLKINKDDFDWFLGVISVKYKNNEKIKNFLPKTNKVDSPKEYTNTFDEFLTLSRGRKYRCAFAFWATESEYNKCLTYLQTTDNKEDVRKILREFQYKDCPKKIPVDILLSLLHKHGKEMDCEIYETLSYIKSKEVEQLALTLLNDKENRVSAIHMLMVNYKKEYKNLLVNAYKKVVFSFNYHTLLTRYTIDFMYSTKKDLPDEILFYAYEKSYCAFNREYIIDCMKKRNLLTKEMLNELQYDSVYEISKKAQRWLKKV